MKKTVLFGLLITALSFWACDKVDDPYVHVDKKIDDIGEAKFNDTVYNDSSHTTRRILIEDFTGHQCPNCPEAAEIANDLMKAFPNDVVSVAVHAGSFARTDPSKGFVKDFTTQTGEKLRVRFQIGMFPNGLVNRIQFNNSFQVSYVQWSNVVNIYLADAAYMAKRFQVNLTNIYNTESRVLRILPEVRALDNFTGNFHLVAFIAENDIIAPQIDNRKSPATVMDYRHMHVLRVGLPQDGDGKLIFANPKAGDVFRVNAEEDELRFQVSEDWVAENCEVIVFLVNRDTEEIMQVDKLKLTKD